MPTNPPETLQLVADQLEASLKTYLGPNTFYLLVFTDKLGPDANCNAISNIPIESSDQILDIFAQLSKRHVQAHN